MSDFIGERLPPSDGKREPISIALVLLVFVSSLFSLKITQRNRWRLGRANCTIYTIYTMWNITNDQILATIFLPSHLTLWSLHPYLAAREGPVKTRDISIKSQPDQTELLYILLPVAKATLEIPGHCHWVRESVSESHFSISSMMLYHFISVCVSTSKCSPRISIETMKNQSSATIVYSGLVNPTDLLCLWVLYIKDNNS